MLRQPFLGLILSGRRTLESRFSRNRIAPYRAIRPGDVIAYKAASGPMLGVAAVEDASFHELGERDDHDDLRRRYAKRLFVEDDRFRHDRRHARYATPLRVVQGLLALMVIQHARRRARFAGEDLVLLKDQDRSLWDAGEIAAGREQLDRAVALRGRGPYVLQAAIAAPQSEERIDWSEIEALYERLVQITLVGGGAQPRCGRGRGRRH